MTKQYVDLVIRMFYPEKKEDAKDYCMTGLKESLKKERSAKQNKGTLIIKQTYQKVNKWN